MPDPGLIHTFKWAITWCLLDVTLLSKQQLDDWVWDTFTQATAWWLGDEKGFKMSNIRVV